MRKLVVASAFAAVTLAPLSAAACDWNREASTGRQVATTATTPPQASQPNSTTTQAPTAVSDNKPAEPTAPVVLVNERH